MFKLNIFKNKNREEIIKINEKLDLIIREVETINSFLHDLNGGDLQKKTIIPNNAIKIIEQRTNTRFLCITDVVRFLREKHGAEIIPKNIYNIIREGTKHGKFKYADYIFMRDKD